MHFNRSLILLLLLILSRPYAPAQEAVLVVGDPIAQFNHAEDIAKWLESIEKLNTQIDQMRQYIEIANTVKGYIGDPASAANALQMGLLGDSSLTQSVGQLTSALSQTADGLTALRDTGQGLFTPIEFRTPSGFDMQFVSDHFKTFAAVQQQQQNTSTVITDTLDRIRALKSDKASTLAQIRAAASQSEVQKLQAKAEAIDGEIADLGRQQATAQDQLVAQDISNRNDEQMKAQAAREAADKEMSVSLERYSEWQGQITASRQPFH